MNNNKPKKKSKQQEAVPQLRDSNLAHHNIMSAVSPRTAIKIKDDDLWHAWPLYPMYMLRITYQVTYHPFYSYDEDLYGN